MKNRIDIYFIKCQNQKRNGQTKYIKFNVSFYLEKLSSDHLVEKYFILQEVKLQYILYKHIIYFICYLQYLVVLYIS